MLERVYLLLSSALSTLLRMVKLLYPLFVEHNLSPPDIYILKIKYISMFDAETNSNYLTF